jgi:uncharacterized membrane protein
MKTSGALRVVFGILALSYPAVVYWQLKHGPAAGATLALGAILLGRLLFGLKPGHRGRSALIFALPLAACAASSIAQRHDLTLYFPVLTSILFLISFGFTLIQPPSAVESLARLVVPDLSPAEVSYCRGATQLWAGFFALNATVAFWTVRTGSLEIWGLYNGLLAYLAMGAVYAGEMTYRHWRFRRYVGMPTDWFFRRLFPPHA